MHATILALSAAAALAAGSAHAVDSDGDGVDDALDNCSALPNADQRDTNGDGFGNVCDADLNNDNIVNVVDLGLLRSVFFTSDADADANGDGTVNVVDLGAMRTQFFGPPGPGAVAPPVNGQRPVFIEHFYDANDQLDATTSIGYNDAGQVTSIVYTLIDDGTPDVLNPDGDASFVATYTYQDSRLAGFEQDLDGAGADLEFAYTYDGDGRLDNTLATTLTDAGLPTSIISIDYTYDAAGRRDQEQWTQVGGGLLVVVTHTYDAAGRILQSDWQNPILPVGGIQFTFAWNANDKLTQQTQDIGRDGIVDEIRDITHTGGRPESLRIFRLADSPQVVRETPAYAADGRIDRIDFDGDDDGSVEAFSVAQWEDGPCEVFFLPQLNPPNNTGRDGDADTLVGDVLFCGP